MLDQLTLPCADGTQSECSGRLPVENVSENYHTLNAQQKWEFQDAADDYNTHSSDDFTTVIDGLDISATPATCPTCGMDG